MLTASSSACEAHLSGKVGRPIGDRTGVVTLTRATQPKAFRTAVYRRQGAHIHAPCARKLLMFMAVSRDRQKSILTLTEEGEEADGH